MVGGAQDIGQRLCHSPSLQSRDPSRPLLVAREIVVHEYGRESGLKLRKDRRYFTVRLDTEIDVQTIVVFDIRTGIEIDAVARVAVGTSENIRERHSGHPSVDGVLVNL